MEEKWSNPPLWPQRLLRYLCSEKHFEILQGDLLELYEYRLQAKGTRMAKLHFIKDTFAEYNPDRSFDGTFFRR
ncbi:permease prefix domain 2-containing transporter [Roseivirga sp.]|uniref:permease prefix domain 2-containing transporter n=1 Tax=Roseivirga sp. TaxID=1964215 RepID=UPI003BA9422E